MSDPHFPDRPSHADFWTLAHIVSEQDARAESGTPLPEEVGSLADLNSVLYVAEQRVLRARMALPPLQRRVDTVRFDIAMQAVWLDGWTTGAHFIQRKTD